MSTLPIPGNTRSRMSLFIGTIHWRLPNVKARKGRKHHVHLLPKHKLVASSISGGDKVCPGGQNKGREFTLCVPYGLAHCWEAGKQKANQLGQKK